MTIERLRQLFDDMLVAEVKHHNGIPPLSKEESDFRMALCEFLLTPTPTYTHHPACDPGWGPANYRCHPDCPIRQTERFANG